MTFYYISYQCGHREKKEVPGNDDDCSYKTRKLCKSCWMKELKLKSAEAAQEAGRLKLPQLNGSEKQIEWAQRVRREILDKLTNIMTNRKSTIEQMTESSDFIMDAISSIYQETSASWWIDCYNNKGIYPESFIFGLIRNRADVIKAEAVNDAEGAGEARAEATVRPGNPKTETVAEIKLLDNKIEVVFPEWRKDGDFSDIMKRLGYKWNKDVRHWIRNISLTTGGIKDRAAETGHTLLKEGFIIRIYDPDVRLNAINGIYEDEEKRWVITIAAGKYAGYLSLYWREFGNCYRQW